MQAASPLPEKQSSALAQKRIRKKKVPSDPTEDSHVARAPKKTKNKKAEAEKEPESNGAKDDEEEHIRGTEEPDEAPDKNTEKEKKERKSKKSVCKYMDATVVGKAGERPIPWMPGDNAYSEVLITPPDPKLSPIVLKEGYNVTMYHERVSHRDLQATVYLIHCHGGDKSVWRVVLCEAGDRTPTTRALADIIDIFPRPEADSKEAREAYWQEMKSQETRILKKRATIQQGRVERSIAAAKARGTSPRKAVRAPDLPCEVCEIRANLETAKHELAEVLGEARDVLAEFKDARDATVEVNKELHRTATLFSKLYDVALAKALGRSIE